MRKDKGKTLKLHVVTERVTSRRLSYLPPPILYSFQCYISRDVLSCSAQCIDCFNIHSPKSVFVFLHTPMRCKSVCDKSALKSKSICVSSHLGKLWTENNIYIYICMYVQTHMISGLNNQVWFSKKWFVLFEIKIMANKVLLLRNIENKLRQYEDSKAKTPKKTQR